METETKNLSSSSAEFKMTGAREVLDYTGGSARISEQIKGIELALVESPGFAFDLSKALIETICKTIHSDRSIPVDNKQKLPELFKATCKILRLSPDSISGSTAEDSLKKTANGMLTTIQGICELRRSYGTASHGREATEESLESEQAEFVARIADALVVFLYRAHRSFPTGKSLRIDFKDQNDFNDYIDEANSPVNIFDLEYRPSEVLFYIDYDAYRDALEDYRSDISTWNTKEE